MVLEHKALHLAAGLPLKDQCRGQPTNTTADYRAIVILASIDYVLGKWIVHGVANGVASSKNWESVAIRGAVLTDTAVAGEIIFILD
jgi:hypothetical protein